MSLRVIPKFRFDGEICWDATRADDGKQMTVVECEVIYPPSQKGKSVRLFLDGDAETALLLLMRDRCRTARGMT